MSTREENALQEAANDIIANPDQNTEQDPESTEVPPILEESPVRSYQTDICEPVLPIVEEKICPSCIPDPDAPNPPDWKMELKSKPFLNEQICEYQIPVMVNEDGEVFTAADIPAFGGDIERFQEILKDAGVRDIQPISKVSPLTLRDILFRSYVLPGIRLLLRHYGKIETDDYVCTFPATRASGDLQRYDGLDATSDVVEGVASGATAGAVIGSPGGIVGSTIGAVAGGLIGLILGSQRAQNNYSGFDDPKQQEIFELSQRCLTVYQMVKTGLLSAELVNNMIDYVEIPTDEPAADPGVVEIPRPNPQFVMGVSKLLNESKAETGERLFNHTVNVKGLEMYARVVDYDLGQTPGDPIRVLVSIPAHVFDQVPQAPEPEVVDFSGAKDVVIKTREFSGMVSRLGKALDAYGTYQAYWWQTERATLYKTRKREDGGYSVETPDDYIPTGEYDPETDTGGEAGFSNEEYSGDIGGKVGSGIHDDGYRPDTAYQGVLGGTLKGEDSTTTKGDQSIFYIMNYATKIYDFYDALHDLLAANDYVLTTFGINAFGMLNIPEEIKIVFDEDDAGFFLIKAVWVKEKSCPWRRLKVGFDPTFLENTAVLDRTICGYIAFLNEIDAELLAQETPPWLDFIVKYTYPPLIIKYESESLGAPGVRMPIGCIIESAFGDNALRDYLFDEVMSLGDAISYQFNKNSCKLLNQDKKKSGKDYKPPRVYSAKEGADLKGLGRINPTNYQWDGFGEHKEQRLEATAEQQSNIYAGFEGQIRAEGQALKRENFRNDAEYKEALASNANDSKNLELARKNAGNHPFMSLVVSDALSEFRLDSSLLAFFVDDMALAANPTKPFSALTNPFGKGTSGNQSKFSKMLDRLDLCGLSALTLKAIQCLMGGTSLNVAYKAVIKAALDSLDDANWEALWLGLPFDKQLEIAELIKKQIGDLPPPWEWKPGEATKSKKLDKEIVDGSAEATAKYNKAIAEKKAEIEVEKAQKPPPQVQDRDSWYRQQQERLDKLEEDLNYIQYVDNKYDYKYTDEGPKIPLTDIDIPLAGSDRTLSLTQAEIAEISKRVDKHKFSKDFDPESRFARSGTLGKSLATIQKALFAAYTEAVLDLISFDYLLSWLDKQPVAKYFINMIANFDCPYPGLFSPPISSFMATLSLDVCGENRGQIRVPNLNGFGQLGFMNIINVFADALYKALWKVLTSIMVKLIVKVLQILEEAICKSLEIAGRLTAGLLTPGDQGGFMGAVVDTFCGEEDTDEEKEKKAANLLSSLGVKPNDLSGPSSSFVDSYKPLIGTMNNISTKNEYKKLLVTPPGEMDTTLLDRISRAVTALHPQWAPIFQDPANVAQIFAAAGNLLSPGQRQAMKADLDNPSDDTPIEDSICLTNAELENWNENRIKLFTDKGVPDEIAKAWIEDQNSKIESDLVDLSSIAARSLDAPLQDALDDLLNMDNANSDGCDVKTTGLSFNNDITSGLAESQSKGVWKAIGQTFQKDLLGGNMLWNRDDGILDHILADRGHNGLRKHQRQVRNAWFTPNVENSQFDHDRKKALYKETRPPWWVETFLADEVVNPFPDTVGIMVNRQFLEQAEKIDINGGSNKRESVGEARQWVYNIEHEGNNVSVLYMPEPFIRKEPDFIFEFKNKFMEEDDSKWNYGFEMEYSSYEVSSGDTNPGFAIRNFDYSVVTKILTSTNAARIVPEGGDTGDNSDNATPDAERVSYYVKYKFNVDTFVPEPVQELIDSYDMDYSMLESKINYQGMCFWGMFTEQWKRIGADVEMLSSKASKWNNIWSDMTNKVYNRTMKCLMRPEDPDSQNTENYIPNAFKFGYSPDATITFNDLLYVNPEATDNKDTWYYDYPEEAKVLGKSATDNPRVHFLNPAQHGGWYSFPKIYVEPYDFDGVLKLSQMMVPEIDGCSPKQTDFLHTDDLSDLQQRVAKSIPPDKRLSFKEECVYKRPFDLITAPEIHGYIQATVVAIIRTHISDYILRAMPSFGVLEFSYLNYDRFISSIIYENMKREMMERNPWFGKFIFIKKHVYWYLFLEQVAQIAMRRFEDQRDEMFYQREEVKASIEKILQAKEDYAHIGPGRVEQMINLTERVYTLQGLKFKWSQEQYNRLNELDTTRPDKAKVSEDLELQRKSIMQSNLPQSGNPVTKGLPWYKQVQHGLNLIEHGPDYKNWIALLKSNNNDHPITAGLKVSLVGGLVGGATAFFTTAAAATGVGIAVLAVGAILVNLSDRDQASNFSEALGPFQRWDWKPNLIGSSLYMGIYQKAAKIYTIASVEEECVGLLKLMIDEQLGFYSEQLATNRAVKPDITHLAKFLIGAGNGIMFSEDLKSGKRKVEVPVSAQGTAGEPILSYEEVVGNVSNVDPMPSEARSYTDDPNWSPASGGMFLQKYIRIVDKEELEEPEYILEQVPNWIKNRPDDLRGVVNIEKFKKYYQETRDIAIQNPDSDLGFDERHFISQLFGNLRPFETPPTEESEGSSIVVGNTVGIRFGLRLMYKPPDQVVSTNVLTEEITKISNREKAYFYNDLNTVSEENATSPSKIVPLVIFEKDMIDKKLQDIDFVNDSFLGEDFRCYVDNLVESPKFKLLYDHIFPVKRVSSLMSAYIYNGWFASIGATEEERDNPEPIDLENEQVWQEGTFDDTKNTLYKMFKSYYQADSWKWEWDWDWDPNFRLWFRMNVPYFNGPNLDGSTTWWQRWRIQKDKPFDKNNQECTGPFGKFFNYG